MNNNNTSARALEAGCKGVFSTTYAAGAKRHVAARALGQFTGATASTT